MRSYARRLFDETSAKEALQYSFVLWLAMFTVITFIAVATGQVSKPGEWLSALTGLTTAVAFAYALFLGFRLSWGRPALIAGGLVITSIAIASAGQTAADYGGQFLLHTIFADMVMPQTSAAFVGRTLFYYLCCYSLNAAIFYIASANRRVRDHQLDLAQAHARTAMAELAALRLQLNPHFMFNALNAVSSLIVTRRYDDAEKTVDRLADFLRASLELDPSAKAPLGEEIEMLGAYLDIEHVRFAERLVVDFDIPPALDQALVPQLILQPLVENAIKYAVAPATEPVTITICARQEGPVLVLKVHNTLPGNGAAKPPAARGAGVGLKNTEARLATLYGDEAVLSAGPQAHGYGVELRLPYAQAAALAQAVAA